MGKVKRREGKAISQAKHVQGQLGGKVTILSGASQGIGHRIALRLGLAGAFVGLADLYEKACSEIRVSYKKKETPWDRGQ